MKKLLTVLLSALMLLTLAACSSNNDTVCVQKTDEELMAEGWTKDTTVALPELTVDTNATYKKSKEDTTDTACEVGVFSADCGSVNKTNLFDYMGRDDVLYIDLRDFSDYTKKHLRNFECIPYFAYIFDAEAGTEGKPQLFGGSVTEPVATYEESLSLLKELFPQDKTIFLMCQSGGRVAQCMNLLNALGWDMSKIYNVGGRGQYTDAGFEPYVVDAAECTVTATYSFEGLTPVK